MDDDIDISATNPYTPNTGIPVFAGRTQAFLQLQNHLNNPHQHSAFTFVGRRRIGKTALLHQLAVQGHSPTIGIYAALDQYPTDANLWLYTLVTSLISTLEANGYPPLDEPGDPPQETDALREWLATRYLPLTLRRIRPYHRLLLLMDDLQYLHTAIMEGHLPEDLPAYLHGLLQPEFDIVLTVDLEFEQLIETFTPLINKAALYRLSRLPQDEHDTLYLPLGIYDDTVLRGLYRATGGEPVLASRFGARLYEQQSNQEISSKTVQQVTPMVYNQSEADCLLLWHNLDRDAQLVLTAISSLLYQDSIRPIDTMRIEQWMVETDYLLDATTINAAIRTLEYHELVSGTASDIRINAGIVQKWLLENALLTEQEATTPRRLLLLAGVLLIIIFTLAVATINAIPAEPPSQTTAPTLTLEAD